MKKRSVFGLVMALCMAPTLAFGPTVAFGADTLPTTSATAAAVTAGQGLSPGGTIPYTPEIHEFVKHSKKPYILDFYATWCGTCRAQERAIDRLREQNGDYNDITVLKVNWDAYRAEPVARDLNVPRRSTLVLLMGEKEIDRIIASTRIRDIKNLFDRGLKYEP